MKNFIIWMLKPIFIILDNWCPPLVDTFFFHRKFDKINTKNTIEKEMEYYEKG